MLIDVIEHLDRFDDEDAVNDSFLP